MNALRAFVLLAPLCLGHVAQAGVSMPASSCVPNHATIEDNRALVGNASVQHAGTNIDPIVLTCPITTLGPLTSDIWRISMTYVDSNGAVANAFVRARIYRQAFDSATANLLATVDSNDAAVTGLNDLESDEFSHTFQLGPNVYWFHIDLQRASAGQTVILHSVALHPIFESDIRAKHNIALLGHLENGLGFYRFSYNGSDKAYVGVMAQEVETIRPDAVVRGSDGYLRVFYYRLGLRMQRWEDWLAAGGKIPAVAEP